MANVYDLIIIGASFEGLCLANYYALSGKKIAIIESAPIKKIGNEAKSMLLWDKYINILKDFFGIRIPSKFIENGFKSLDLSFGSKKESIEAESYLINEKMLIYYIIGRIIEFENVSFFDKSEFLGFIYDNKRISGVKIKSAEAEELSGKIIVDASESKAAGRTMLKDNAYFTKFIDEKILYPFCEEIVLDSGVHGMNFFIDPEKKDAGFVSIVPKNDGKAIVRAVIFDKIVDPKKYLDDFKEKNLPNSKTLHSRIGKCALSNPFYGFCYQNFIIVGASALQNNPFLFEDYSLRINACVSICKEAEQAFSLVEIFTNDLWGCNSSFMRKHGYKLKIFEELKKLLNSLSPEEIETLIGSGKISNIASSGKIEGVGSLIFKPALFGKILKFNSMIEKIKDRYSKYPEYDDFAVWKNSE